MTEPLPTTPPEDPIPLAQRWISEAVGLIPRNPNAMALATRDANGSPSVRMVLLKELAAPGYAVFYTNYGSRKASELSTGRAAAVLYWDRLGHQLRLEGFAVRSPVEESDAYFATRPWRSQLNAWVSQQSAPLQDDSELERRATAKAIEMGVDPSNPSATPNQHLPRPAHWGGYRLWLDAIEFWVEGEDRFHERLRYERRVDALHDPTPMLGRWTRLRLQP